MNLNQATIYTDKPVATAEFFQKLGLKIIVDSLPRYARLECPDGDSTLSIQEADDVQVTNNVVLYFECEELDRTVEELKSNGLSFDEDPPDRPDARRWLGR